MMSFSAFMFWLWGIFVMGWIGTGIIAVAALAEVVSMFLRKNSKVSAGRA